MQKKIEASKAIEQVQKRASLLLDQFNRLEEEGIYRAYSLSPQNVEKLRETLTRQVNTTCDQIRDEVERLKTGKKKTEVRADFKF